MDLRRLRHVVALADELHFGRAAERVHLSQPAFSRSIQAIEEDLGIRLFDRNLAELRLTPAGDFVVKRARRLLFDARCMQRDIDLYRGADLGNTAFGCGPIPAVSLMPRVLSELRRLHPQVALRVEESNWQQLLESLRAEDIEFFVSDTSDLPQDASLKIRLLPKQQIHFYVRAKHPLASRRCAIADVWEFGLAAAKAPTGIRAKLASLLGLPAGEAPVIALECDNFSIARSVALATDMVLAATHALVQPDLAAGKVLALRMKTPLSMFSRLGIVSLQNRTPSPMAQLAMTCIERAAVEMDRSN